MGVRGTGEGPKVVHHNAASRKEAASVLADEIERLTGPGGLSQSEISILSPLSFSESAAVLLPQALATDIIELDEYAVFDFPPQRISFAPIQHFKGLENEAVILIDLPRPATAAEAVPDHYVGMSRARSLLITIMTDAAT